MTFCAEPGCGVLVESGRCPTHARAAWGSVTHGTPTRFRGCRLQRARRRLFDRQPLCVACLARGRVTLATVRDHILGLADGGADADANTQALCRACNEAKRQEESLRGARKWK